VGKEEKWRKREKEEFLQCRDRHNILERKEEGKEKGKGGKKK
jgi:hypothetical protein